MGKLSPGEDDHPKAQRAQHGHTLRIRRAALFIKMVRTVVFNPRTARRRIYVDLEIPGLCEILELVGNIDPMVELDLGVSQPSLGTFCYDHDCGGRLHGRPRAIVHAFEHGGRAYSPLTRSVLIAISNQVGNGVPLPHLDIIACRQMIQMVSGADFVAIFQLFGLAHPRTRLDKAHGLINRQKALCYLDKMVWRYRRAKHVAPKSRRRRALKIEVDECVDMVELFSWNTKRNQIVGNDPNCR